MLKMQGRAIFVLLCRFMGVSRDGEDSLIREFDDSSRGIETTSERID